jgi:hypothetical protein
MEQRYRSALAVSPELAMVTTPVGYSYLRLVFCGRKRHNEIEARTGGADSVFELAPQPVSAGSGALCVSGRSLIIHAECLPRPDRSR